MNLWEKAKGVVDFGRRVQFLYQMASLAVSSAAGTAAWKWITKNQAWVDYRLPLSLLAAAIVLFLIPTITLRFRKKPPESDVNEAILAVKYHAGRGILLSHLQAEASALQSQLEELWHHWDSAGEKLIHPLNLIEKVKDWSSAENARKLDDERREFMLLYVHHFRDVKHEFPEFTSAVIEAGYPSNLEYVRVIANLKSHAERLKGESEVSWNKY